MSDIGNGPRGDRLAEAVREFETLCFAVSRDMQMPLEALDGAIQAMTERRVGSNTAQELLDMRANIAAMRSVTANLREFYGLASQPIVLEAIDMQALALEAWAGFENVESRAFALGKLPAARGHRGMLKLAWKNLLRNAILRTANRRGPRIEVSGAVSGEAAVYSVRDNGTPFELDYAGKLQYVFERIQKHAGPAGTAAELVIVQRIVTRHRGNVWLETLKDKGALFQFSIPTELQSGAA